MNEVLLKPDKVLVGSRWYIYPYIDRITADKPPRGVPQHDWDVSRSIGPPQTRLGPGAPIRKPTRKIQLTRGKDRKWLP